jgi:hypothetical protein
MVISPHAQLASAETYDTGIAGPKHPHECPWPQPHFLQTMNNIFRSRERDDLRPLPGGKLLHPDNLSGGRLFSPKTVSSPRKPNHQIPSAMLGTRQNGSRLKCLFADKINWRANPEDHRKSQQQVTVEI